MSLSLSPSNGRVAMRRVARLQGQDQVIAVEPSVAVEVALAPVGRLILSVLISLQQHHQIPLVKVAVQVGITRQRRCGFDADSVPPNRELHLIPILVHRRPFSQHFTRAYRRVAMWRIARLQGQDQVIAVEPSVAVEVALAPVSGLVLAVLVVLQQLHQIQLVEVPHLGWRPQRGAIPQR